MALPESVSKRMSASKLDHMSERELRALVMALVDGIQALATKLDADAGVTDTNYGAVFAGFVTD